MARLQRRWVCRGCEREWAFSTMPSQPCPLCGDPRVDQVEYIPVAPGADTRSSSSEWAGVEQTLHMRPAVERPNLVRDRNELLMRVDPYVEQLSALIGVEL